MAAATMPLTLGTSEKSQVINPWLIAVTVTLATFMELLDTAIANGFCGCVHSSSPISSEGLVFFLRPSVIARDQPERPRATNGSTIGRVFFAV